MKSICSIGECMLELSGADDQWRMGYAGDTFNALWAMRALMPYDYVTDFISAFGDDPFSARQISFFSDHGIGTGNSPIIEGGSPGLYAITLDGAERSFTYWRSASAARNLAGDGALLTESLANRRLIYFSGISLAILDAKARDTLIGAVAAARRSGSLVAFDPNYRPRLWSSKEEARDAITTALGVCDIALPTFPDESALFGDASPAVTSDRLQEAGVREIVVKNGDEAAEVTVGGQRETIPAVDVAHPVDTTGAGDSFNGAYLAARLRDSGPVEAAKCAHNVAASVVQVRGALAPFETLREAFG